MIERLPVVVFLAGRPDKAGELERWLAAAQLAATQDALARALADAACGPCYVVSCDPAVAAAFDGWPVRVVPAPQPFHFGHALAELAQRERLDALVYLSGGLTALLPTTWVTTVAVQLGPGRVVTNNRFSCDLAAFMPASALARVRALARDNDLAWALAHDAGLEAVELPRDAAFGYDLDSPVDLLVLRLAAEPGPTLARCLADAPCDDGWLRAAARPLADANAEVAISGRVATDTLSYLDREAACRKRVVIEERGMEASGRAARGEARSLVGWLIDALGPTGLVAACAQTSAALFLDTRVLLAHAGRNVTIADRFAADLLLAERVGDPWLRALAAAARAAPRPVALGGHTLLNAGLRLLTAWGWRERALTAASRSE
jgi:hypothetical protein